MAKKLETFGGNHIRDVVAQAVALAIKSGEIVEFDFNGKVYTVNPDDSYETAKARAEGVLGHPILTADEDAAKASADLDRMRREQDAAIAAAGVATEGELRAADVPWCKTPEELIAYINSLVNRPHDYGTCVYAMSMAAVAAFHYAASVLGTTGFQASCADMDIVRRTRHLKGPFMILDGEKMLYPQYDLREQLDEFLREGTPWAAKEARKRLATDGEHAHPHVKAHWERLAAIGG